MKKITFHGFANSTISQQCTTAAHTEAVHCGGPLGVFHPCLWPQKAPGCTLGRVTKPLVYLASNASTQSDSYKQCWPSYDCLVIFHLSSFWFTFWLLVHYSDDSRGAKLPDHVQKVRHDVVLLASVNLLQAYFQCYVFLGVFRNSLHQCSHLFHELCRLSLNTVSGDR